MTSILFTAAVAAVIVLLCVAAMSIGVIVRGRFIRTGCGGNPQTDGGCETCQKRQINLCKCDDAGNPLSDASMLSTMGRFEDDKKDDHPAGDQRG